MKQILFTLALWMLFSGQAFSACQIGTSEFSWKTMKNEYCDENRAARSETLLPWQGIDDQCTWVDFPLNKKQTGNSVCRTARMGSCKAVVRDDKSARLAFYYTKNKPLIKGENTYECSEELMFKPARENCQQVQQMPDFMGLPPDPNAPVICSQMVTKISCCK